MTQENTALLEAHASALSFVQMGFAKQILLNVLGEDVEDRIKPDAMLVDDLGADSLDMVEVQCILDDHGLDAPDSAFTHHMRVRDLAAMITPGGVS
ncbi:acyl carrier protein [Sphingobium yanoikuyae]|uniref:acyl carrier protein n=1 Tax=Sphingobium yanoikuyae TaxID=13690 RepID=UPI0026ED83A9|nr:phosphopantetheine-binding protein [Sphingobium yanoikuyae]